jgi:hypothetical protein
MAWLVWAVLFGVALSLFDPTAGWWDEVMLGALALIVVWSGPVGARRAGH